MQTTKHSWLIASLTSLALAAGCAAQSSEDFDDADAIANALELENGGLTMEDEAPVFDDYALFDEAELLDTEVDFTDAIEQDAAVQDMLRDVDAIAYHTTVMWGQIPGDRENDTAYNWSGTISVNRGAIIVRRVLAFDGRIDGVLPRDNPRVVAFRSATLPHRDGLRLLIIDPEPLADEPLVLTYTSSANDQSFSAPMATLVGEGHSLEVDQAGNRIVIMAMRRPIDVCENGFLGGRWHKVAEHRGRILGRIGDGEGNPVGHLRGVYGQRRNGDKVFFAKFINRDGQFRGILRGTYGDGHFVGRWLTRSGEHGALGGEYRETRPGPRVAGHFLGRWAETSCNLDVSGR